MAPAGAEWEQAVEYWSQLPSDADAEYETEVTFSALDVAPQVTWGTSPEDVLPVTGVVPDPADYAESDPNHAAKIERALEYMGLTAGERLDSLAVDKVFIGSCTNSRIEDLRAVAEVVASAPEGARQVREGIHAYVVPGSGLVKAMAEEEGIDKVLTAAGFDWREPGCSMCTFGFVVLCVFRVLWLFCSRGEMKVHGHVCCPP